MGVCSGRQKSYNQEESTIKDGELEDSHKEQTQTLLETQVGVKMEGGEGGGDGGVDGEATASHDPSSEGTSGGKSRFKDRYLIEKPVMMLEPERRKFFDYFCAGFHLDHTHDDSQQFPSRSTKDFSPTPPDEPPSEGKGASQSTTPSKGMPTVGHQWVLTRAAFSFMVDDPPIDTLHEYNFNKHKLEQVMRALGFSVQPILLHHSFQHASTRNQTSTFLSHQQMRDQYVKMKDHIIKHHGFDDDVDDDDKEDDHEFDGHEPDWQLPIGGGGRFYLESLDQVIQEVHRSTTLLWGLGTEQEDPSIMWKYCTCNTEKPLWMHQYDKARGIVKERLGRRGARDHRKLKNLLKAHRTLASIREHCLVHVMTDEVFNVMDVDRSRNVDFNEFAKFFARVSGQYGSEFKTGISQDLSKPGSGEESADTRAMHRSQLLEQAIAEQRKEEIREQHIERQLVVIDEKVLDKVKEVKNQQLEFFFAQVDESVLRFVSQSEYPSPEDFSTFQQSKQRGKAFAFFTNYTWKRFINQMKKLEGTEYYAVLNFRFIPTNPLSGGVLHEKSDTGTPVGGKFKNKIGAKLKNIPASIQRRTSFDTAVVVALRRCSDKFLLRQQMSWSVCQLLAKDGEIPVTYPIRVTGSKALKEDLERILSASPKDQSY